MLTFIGLISLLIAVTMAAGITQDPLMNDDERKVTLMASSIVITYIGLTLWK